jgi:hypothetical protein
MTINTRDITDILGAPEADTKFDSTNFIDLFPVIDEDPLGGSNPSTGTITIQGVTFPTRLWDEGEFRSYKFENGHHCDFGAGITLQPHMRVFPTNDNAGTIQFTYDYFFLNVDGTTTAGGTCTMNGTIVAGDKTANKGIYISCLLDATNMQGGDQIVGVLTRTAGTYASKVAPTEFGIHAPVKSTGFPIDLGV